MLRGRRGERAVSGLFAGLATLEVVGLGGQFHVTCQPETPDEQTSGSANAPLGAGEHRDQVAE